ncbi:MAG: ABC transporter permease [Betaproteobacteria bacterium]|nr:ABC transporter permease [Betaproteobacteria bacterium]
MNAFQIVVLGSDFLFALLLAAMAVGIVFAFRREHLRRTWRKVFAGRTAMVALVLLLVYLLVSVLDSLHYRPALDAQPGVNEMRRQYATEVFSLLDLALTRLRDSTEKSYSAPFAAYLYEKQMITEPDGSLRRDYPRLTHGAAHLADPNAERAGDIGLRALQGVVTGGLVWLALFLPFALIAGRKRGETLKQSCRAILRGETVLAWDAFAWALLLVCILVAVLAFLSGGYHVFGTDAIGNDVLYRTLKSMRTALLFGTLSTLVVLPLGIGLGLAAGYFGGWIDDLIQYLYTVISSIPYVLLIAAAALMMQLVIEQHSEIFNTVASRSDARLVSLCLIIGAISWTSLCRLLRAETLKLREQDYVQAARCFGVPSLRIMTRHILPNAFHIVLINLVLDFSALVLAEAVLSYVGVGVDPATQSFGVMINGARGELAREPVIWWSLTAAFIFMLALVLSANLFADAVREAFDPRARTLPRRRLLRSAAR